VLALQGGKGEVPSEYIEMKLCEKFSCLPNELYQIPREKIELYLQIMNIENEFQKRDQRLSEKKLNKKRVPK